MTEAHPDVRVKTFVEKLEKFVKVDGTVPFNTDKQVEKKITKLEGKLERLHEWKNLLETS